MKRVLAVLIVATSTACASSSGHFVRVSDSESFCWATRDAGHPKSFSCADRHKIIAAGLPYDYKGSVQTAKLAPIQQCMAKSGLFPLFVSNSPGVPRDCSDYLPIGDCPSLGK